MTTSANIAGVPTGFAPVPKGGAWPYSKKKIWHIDELKPGKKPKIGSKLYYGQVGMLVLRRGMSEEKSPLVVDKPDKDKDKYEYKGKVGVWRTISGKRYFFPDDGSSSIPPIKDKVKKKLGGDAAKAVKKQDRSAKQINVIVAGLKDQRKIAKLDGKKGKAKRIKQQIKDIEAGGMGAVKALAASKVTLKKDDEGKATGETEMEGDWSDFAEEKLLPKIQEMMKKASTKENKAAFAALKKMEGAIRKGDKKAYSSAVAMLKKAIKKTTKVVAKQKKKEAKKQRKFKPGILGKFLKGLSK